MNLSQKLIAYILFISCLSISGFVTAQEGMGHGMDPAILSKIPAEMQRFVDDEKMAGAVTMVIRNGQVAALEATGFSDIEEQSPIEINTIFRIASMTKPFVGAAIMMLVEKEKLNLDDPVEKYLPEFSGMWLREEENDMEMHLIKPSRPITIRDLLTHTSGLAGLPRNVRVNDLREHCLVTSQLPIAFEPGTQWKYSGEGIVTAARIVETVSGLSYTDFLKDSIFIPLEMHDTYFFFPEEQAYRVATLYYPGEEAGLKAYDGRYRARYFQPAGGLYSTAEDMAKWMQTLMDGGLHGETRILTEESVKEMTSIQTGNLETGFTAGMSFGLAFGVVREPQDVTGMLSPGTYGHGGAFGTQYWADPVTRTIYILMIQRHRFGNSDASAIRKVFQEIASSAIIK